MRESDKKIWYLTLQLGPLQDSFVIPPQFGGVRPGDKVKVIGEVRYATFGGRLERRFHVTDVQVVRETVDSLPVGGPPAKPAGRPA